MATLLVLAASTPPSERSELSTANIAAASGVSTCTEKSLLDAAALRATLAAAGWRVQESGGTFRISR